MHSSWAGRVGGYPHVYTHRAMARPTTAAPSTRPPHRCLVPEAIHTPRAYTGGTRVRQHTAAAWSPREAAAWARGLRLGHHPSPGPTLRLARARPQHWANVGHANTMTRATTGSTNPNTRCAWTARVSEGAEATGVATARSSACRTPPHTVSSQGKQRRGMRYHTHAGVL
jgi:hypothetical protein